MSSSDPSTRTCGYPKCGRKTNQWSNLCTTHHMQAWRHGAAGKAGVREQDYKPFNNWCADGLARYRNTAATAAALQIANTLLNYTATHEFRYQTELARMMGLLRMDDVNASDVLQRVCLHTAFVTANPQRFSGGPKVEKLALARCVMRLCPLKRYGARWAPRSLLELADIIAEDGLYLFAIRLVDKLKQDDAERRALADAALDFETPAVVPQDQPRASVRYRRTRGLEVP